MNRSNWDHVGYALIMQVVIGALGWPFFGFAHSLAGGALFAIAFFVSREHSQREQSLAVDHRVPANPFLGFTGWSIDAKLDAICPAVAVLLVAIVAKIIA